MKTGKNTLNLDGNYAQEMLSWYLWGQAEPPSPSEIADAHFIRKNGEGATVHVDAPKYMDKIGKNFPVARQIMFQLFFNGRKRGNDDNILGDQVSLEELKKGGAINSGSEIMLNHRQFVEIFYGKNDKHYLEARKAILKSSQYRIENNSSDYWMRGFAFGSTFFELDAENIKYIFDANTGKPLRIDNLKLRPYADNFDFESNDPAAIPINKILKQIMDPSGIGRTVNIEFDNNKFFTLPSGTSYTQDNYREYVKKYSKRGFGDTYPDLPGTLGYSLDYGKYFEGLKKLHESDVYNFRDSNNRITLFDGDNDNIIQGTKGDNLDIKNDINVSSLGFFKGAGAEIVYDLENFNKYREYLKNGITYVGGDGDDTIEGTEYSDILKGNSDNDTLSGKGGDDQLEGGSGSDTYYIEGHDTVFDADSMGKLFFGKDKAEYFIPETPNSDDSWISSDSNGEPDGKFRAFRDGKNLVVTSVANEADKVTVKDYFNGRDTLDGALDLHDVAPKPGEATEYTITPKRYDVHNEYNLGPDSYLVQGSLENDLIWANSALSGKSGYGLITQTGAGNDIVYGSLYPDIIEGGADTDVLFGSAPKTALSWKRKVLDANLMSGNEGRDFIMGGFGNDIIHAGNINEHLQLQERKGQGDWVNGAEGDDSLYGSAAQDIVQGGAGADTIRGGAGNDLLVGDSNAMVYAHIDRSHGAYLPITHIHSYNLKEKRWNRIEEVQISNRLIDKSVAWKLEIDHDKQDYFITRDYHDWKNNASLVAEEEGAGDDIEGGTGDDMLIGQRGDDVLNGQGGDDIVFGDDNRDKSIVGNDHLRGGSGSDTLIGGKGADSYYFFREELQPEEGKPAPTDIVIDDGRGDGNKMDEIFLDGLSISSFKWNYDKKRKIWSDDENGWQIIKKGSELNITHKDYPGVIRVLDYAYGDYELRLSENKNGPFPDPEPAKPVPPQPVPPQPEPPKPEQPKPEQPQAPTAGKPLAAQSIHEKDKLSYTLAEDTFHTANKDDKLSYSARLADGKPLPKWLNFDAATRTFSGTPGNDDVGTLDIEISVQGKGGSGSQHLALNVINVNDAPYISAPFSLHSTNSGGEIKCNSRTYIRDIDKGDKLTFSAEMRDGQPLPSWLSINAETGVLTGTLPFARETKDYYVRITATDKAGASTSGVLLIRGEFRRGRRNGTDNDDILKGGLPRMNMIIHGYGGNDTITGSNLHDDLYGDKGNDVLDGGSGNDIYHFARGDGNDIINNHDTGARRHDSIDFSDMNRSDFDIRREGNNLVLRSKDGNNQITVTNHFQPGWQIDGIRFADGMTLDHNAINSLTGAQNPPQGNYTDPATQALQMNQAIASLNSQAQPLDALATPDLQPRPLLAAGNP